MFIPILLISFTLNRHNWKDIALGLIGMMNEWPLLFVIIHYAFLPLYVSTLFLTIYFIGKIVDLQDIMFSLKNMFICLLEYLYYSLNRLIYIDLLVNNILLLYPFSLYSNPLAVITPKFLYHTNTKESMIYHCLDNIVRDVLISVKLQWKAAFSTSEYANGRRISNHFSERNKSMNSRFRIIVLYSYWKTTIPIQTLLFC